ncbi:hypothetical protein HU200_015268 [Digitaria exilis]|uniref:Uncharacterized protein n=1 Tax=Digitaria exilis TaxID=1010633 RepID=A0A835FAA2_9POAL|nr:hypothetical protein HU200_015268 [Digitaria exilis]
MPRGRRPPPRPRPAPVVAGDRRLAEEVLYLHSLWRRGPPGAAPAPTQPPSSSAARNQTETTKRKRPAVAARKAKTIELKRLRREATAAAAAGPKDHGFEWPVAPSPPNSSPKAWPDAAPPSTSTPAKPPPPPPSPGARAQREALRAAAEFLSNRGSSYDNDDDDAGSESDGEEDAAGFITGLFVRDAALRGHYERGWEEGHFECLACAGGNRKAGRRFKGCAALVQHAGAGPTRYGRSRAHRALAAVVCRVLGWDVATLPSIVIDPRGTLGQELAAEATAGAQLAEVTGLSIESFGFAAEILSFDCLLNLIRLLMSGQ